MRTNIDISDELIKQAMQVSGLKTKKETVEQALKTLLRLSQQQQIRALRGKLDWQGDLETMRTDAQ